MAENLYSLVIVVMCTAGIAWLARMNFLANRDAGNGWRFIYWQPWRVWLISICLAISLIIIGFMVWAGLTMPRPAAALDRPAVPVLLEQ